MAEKHFELGSEVPAAARLEVLQTPWTYRELESTRLDDLGEPTDLVVHRIRVQEGTPVSQSRPKKMARDKEWFLRKHAMEGFQASMYERCMEVNGELSQWNASVRLVKKPAGEWRVTFNYHYVFEPPPGTLMQPLQDCHEFLGNPRIKVFSSLDLKNAYWTILIHPANRYTLAFSVPGLGQLQPKRMSQRARSSLFTVNELGHTAFGPIPAPDPGPSLIHNDAGPDESPHTKFYIDDLAPGHATITSCLAKLRITFDKVKIGMKKITILGKTHQAGGRHAMKPEHVRKILEWPEPRDAADVRRFHGLVTGASAYIKNFSEVARPLRRLMSGRLEWQWGDAEEVSFGLLKELAAAAVEAHGHDPALPCDM
ncbi:hypothetical protein AC579_10302 [Pseudocercospora musae]|uniref:Reverse transcriptase domain-containing protein n=1 Tax=Pseudocercospora musae TaxID=113226 RepID=A0A139GWQ2_9PEZI|nr:hypothetical protein AC579_10302 [Pseudocercospora musae]